MRHGMAGNKLGRMSSHRKATVRDVAKATLIQQRICTTKAKAREARKLVDKLITMGKKGTLAEKRRAFAVLCDHRLVSQLFNETSPLFKDRVGGYTRIIPLGARRGDNAQLVFLELTEKNKVIVTPVKAAVKSKKADKVKNSNEQEDAVIVEEKPKAEKTSAVKSTKKGGSQTEKTKDSKNIVGGIKKMFNRKAGEK